jgi:hypothetical protein
MNSFIKDVNINIIVLIALILVLFIVVFNFRKQLDGFQTFGLGEVARSEVPPPTVMPNIPSGIPMTIPTTTEISSVPPDTVMPNIPTRISMTRPTMSSSTTQMPSSTTTEIASAPGISFDSFMQLLSTNRLPSWVTNTQMEEIRNFPLKVISFFLITGNFSDDSNIRIKYSELKTSGVSDTIILDNLFTLFNNDIKQRITQYGNSKLPFYYHIAAAIPSFFTNTAWVTPDITKKAQPTLRRLASYTMSKNAFQMPNLNNISDVTIPLKEEHTRSTVAGNNDVQIFNKLNDVINKAIDDGIININKLASSSLSPETLVPVGLKVRCKLSDVSQYVPPISLMPLMMVPLNAQILILDAVTSEVVWDPINYFIDNGTVQPFPTSSESKSYVLYTNAIRFIPNLTSDMLPIQLQQDRDSIDKIIFNSLDTIVNLYKLSILEKILPQASMFTSALSTDNARIFKAVINIVRFETILYEKYSIMIEHFIN